MSDANDRGSGPETRAPARKESAAALPLIVYRNRSTSALVTGLLCAGAGVIVGFYLGQTLERQGAGQHLVNTVRPLEESLKATKAQLDARQQELDRARREVQVAQEALNTVQEARATLQEEARRLTLQVEKLSRNVAQSGPAPSPAGGAPAAGAEPQPASMVWVDDQGVAHVVSGGQLPPEARKPPPLPATTAAPAPAPAQP